MLIVLKYTLFLFLREFWRTNPTETKAVRGLDTIPRWYVNKDPQQVSLESILVSVFEAQGQNQL